MPCVVPTGIRWRTRLGSGNWSSGSRPLCRDRDAGTLSGILLSRFSLQFYSYDFRSRRGRGGSPARGVVRGNPAAMKRLLDQDVHSGCSVVRPMPN